VRQGFEHTELQQKIIGDVNKWYCTVSCLCALLEWMTVVAGVFIGAPNHVLPKGPKPQIFNSCSINTIQMIVFV
jgi:hypothetical protein